MSSLESSWTMHWDLAAAAVAATAAATSYATLPGAHPVRLLLTLAVLLFVPGYALLEALRPSPRAGRDRLMHAALAPGLSLPVVGLLALSTAIVPGGFRPDPIVLVITAACIGLSAAAWVRRWSVDARSDAAQAAPSGVDA